MPPLVSDVSSLPRSMPPAREVLFTQKMGNTASVLENFITADAGSLASGPSEYINEGGETLMRSEWKPDVARLIAWWLLLQHMKPSKSWQLPYQAGRSFGYEELYLEWTMRFGRDHADAARTGGKLPGLNGMHEILGATSPKPPDASLWSGRLGFSGVSKANRGLMRAHWYWYGPDHTSATNPSSGQVRFFNKVPFCWQCGRLVRVLQRVKLNTIKGGEPQRDGVLAVWISQKRDEWVLVHEETDVLIRTVLEAQIPSVFFNVYEGGMAGPAATNHFDVGTITVYKPRTQA
jgi:hypothetical protein